MQCHPTAAPVVFCNRSDISCEKVAEYLYPGSDTAARFCEARRQEGMERIETPLIDPKEQTG